jgi:hypothetical protein
VDGVLGVASRAEPARLEDALNRGSATCCTFAAMRLFGEAIGDRGRVPALAAAVQPPRESPVSRA